MTELSFNLFKHYHDTVDHDWEKQFGLNLVLKKRNDDNCLEFKLTFSYSFESSWLEVKSCSFEGTVVNGDDVDGEEQFKTFLNTFQTKNVEMKDIRLKLNCKKMETLQEKNKQCSFSIQVTLNSKSAQINGEFPKDKDLPEWIFSNEFKSTMSCL